MSHWLPHSVQQPIWKVSTLASPFPPFIPPLPRTHSRMLCCRHPFTVPRRGGCLIWVCSICKQFYTGVVRKAIPAAKGLVSRSVIHPTTSVPDPFRTVNRMLSIGVRFKTADSCTVSDFVERRYYCVTVNGTPGCCPNGKTCTGTPPPPPPPPPPQCATPGYVVCPGENFCCRASTYSFCN
jgi:hypothetical protein